MTTSLCTLSLEVYYRYLPLFKVSESGGPRPGQSGTLTRP